MKIIILRENKDENRVSVVPNDVTKLIANGHEVYFQNECGINASFTNEQYKNAGAHMFDNARKVLADANIVCKLSFLTKKEIKLIRSQEKVIISNLYLANNPKILKIYLKKKITSIGLEFTNDGGVYEYLKKVEDVKGKYGIETATLYMSKTFNKKSIGKQVEKNPEGHANTNFVILNYSYAAHSAIKAALSLGANVTLLESNEGYKKILSHDSELATLQRVHQDKLKFLDGKYDTLMEATKTADVLINTSQIPGARTKLRITSEMIANIHPGGVYVDLGADQGFGSEVTAKPNTVKVPYTIFGKITCIAMENIPSLFPKITSEAASETIVELVGKNKSDILT
jgi:alanine dehydrogenase